MIWTAGWCTSTTRPSLVLLGWYDDILTNWRLKGRQADVEVQTVMACAAGQRDGSSKFLVVVARICRILLCRGVRASDPEIGDYVMHCENNPSLLFTENESNNERLFGSPNSSR